MKPSSKPSSRGECKGKTPGGVAWGGFDRAGGRREHPAVMDSLPRWSRRRREPVEQRSGRFVASPREEFGNE